MKRSVATGAEVGAAVGGVIKVVLMTVASVGAFGFAVLLAVHGNWGAAALVLFIGEPIVLFVADVATGLVLALLIGVGALVGAAGRD